jgi:putative ABC transport system permease protein
LREFRRNIRHLDHEIEARIVGVNPDFFNLAGQTIAQGRLFSDADLYYFANVAVIGPEVAEKLFPYGDPIDKSVRIGEKHFYRIIGVTEFKNKSSPAGNPSNSTSQAFNTQDYNKDVYIPLTTDRARFGETLINEKQGNFTAERVQLSQITVTIDAMENVKRTAEVLDSMLRQFHPKHDFTLTVPLELLEKAEATKRIFNLVLGSIASISLLVGGIGIMNIMLATVSERTREIGIRRAIGARRRDIIQQFLVETTVISAIGGLIGVVLGVAAPPLVGYLSGMPVVIRPWSPIIAFLIAVSTGLVSGLYPARRAARLHPVEALRST